MAMIQCTKKLLDELALDKEMINIIGNKISILGNWHASFFRIERRKCVLFTNDATLFSFFVPKLVKLDFQNLTSVFIRHLISNLIYEGLDQYQEMLLKEYQDNLNFSKSNNRGVMGSMNEMAHIIRAYIYQHGGLNSINYFELNKLLNNVPFKANHYHDAIECLRQLCIYKQTSM